MPAHCMDLTTSGCDDSVAVEPNMYGGVSPNGHHTAGCQRHDATETSRKETHRTASVISHTSEQTQRRINGARVRSGEDMSASLVSSQPQPRPFSRPVMTVLHDALNSNGKELHGTVEKNRTQSRMYPLRRTLSLQQRRKNPSATLEERGNGHDDATHSSSWKQRPIQTPTRRLYRSATAMVVNALHTIYTTGNESQSCQHTHRRVNSFTFNTAPSMHHVKAPVDSPPGKNGHLSRRENGLGSLPHRQSNETLVRHATPITRTATVLSPLSKKAALRPKSVSKNMDTTKKKTNHDSPDKMRRVLLRPPSLKPTSHGGLTTATGGNLASLQPWYARPTRSSVQSFATTQTRERSVVTKTSSMPTRKIEPAVRMASAPCFPKSTTAMCRTHSSHSLLGNQKRTFSSFLNTANDSAGQKTGVKPALQKRSHSGIGGTSTSNGISGGFCKISVQNDRKKISSTPTSTHTPAAVRRTGEVPASRVFTSPCLKSAFRGNDSMKRTPLIPSSAHKEEGKPRRKPKRSVDGNDVLSKNGTSQSKPASKAASITIRATNSTLRKEASTREKERQNIRQKHEQLAAEVRHLPRALWLATRRELGRLVDIRSKRTSGVLVDGDVMTPRTPTTHVFDDSHDENEGNAREMRRRRWRHDASKAAVGTEQPNCLEGPTDRGKRCQEHMCSMHLNHEMKEDGFASPYRGSMQLVSGGQQGTHFLFSPDCRRGPTGVDDNNEVVEVKHKGEVLLSSTLKLRGNGEGREGDGDNNYCRHCHNGGGRGDGRGNADNNNNNNNRSEEGGMMMESCSHGSDCSPSIRPPSEMFDYIPSPPSASAPQPVNGDLIDSECDSPLVVPPLKKQSPLPATRRLRGQKKKTPELNFQRTRSSPHLSYSVTPTRRQFQQEPRLHSRKLYASREGSSLHTYNHSKKNTKVVGHSMRGNRTVVLTSDMLVALYATIHGTAEVNRCNNITRSYRTHSMNNTSSDGLMGHSAQRRGRRLLQNLRMVRTFSYSENKGTRAVGRSF
ncbi:hypothetical protein MOQ_000754 [Trypanosoma cruzi marinkellei]|uniref:Uncharacterized protein n=1 Tax=Trypanosoma cruzi marinkellei TaxID=85056 RepID=K2NI22_TRYCR|nr:hypothetical protein MOQ_000754 [Trypanosoma cruzi marinkellei]